MSDLVKRLRDLSANIRRRPTPLSDAIPMLQQSADRIEHLERVLAQAREALDNMTEHFCLSRLGESTLADSEARIAAHKASSAIDEALKLAENAKP